MVVAIAPSRFLPEWPIAKKPQRQSPALAGLDGNGPVHHVGRKADRVTCAQSKNRRFATAIKYLCSTTGVVRWIVEPDNDGDFPQAGQTGTKVHVPGIFLRCPVPGQLGSCRLIRGDLKSIAPVPGVHHPCNPVQDPIGTMSTMYPVNTAVTQRETTPGHQLALLPLKDR